MNAHKHEIRDSDIAHLESRRAALREKLLNLYKSANAGHIGSSLSCLEILMLCHSVFRGEHDRVVLSKGHAAGGLYCVLDELGLLGVPLTDFYKEGTRLSAHPPCKSPLPRVPFGTGSLGHGLGLAVGMALAQRFAKHEAWTVVIVSEGDLNEGSTWEALMSAAQLKLGRLITIVDANGLQGLGSATEIMNLEPLRAKAESFGHECFETTQGNTYSALAKEMRGILASTSAKPKMLIARTTKGAGVDYMENKFEWHYLPMNDEQFANAIEQVRKT
ncbi:MAG: hypothetical protein KF767_07140 [Bdellovibrionaceae bacterium]|nr:hypothetical protein [Pseudobdellovibrionaceae bacterium]